MDIIAANNIPVDRTATAKSRWSCFVFPGFDSIISDTGIVFLYTPNFMDAAAAIFSGGNCSKTAQVGVHSHFQHNGLEYSTGIGASVLGKQTGLSHFQTALHEAVDEHIPSESVLSRQIGNQVLIGPIVEIADTVPNGDRLTIRPFFEAYATAEMLARAGADVHFGRGFQGHYLYAIPSLVSDTV